MKKNYAIGVFFLLGILFQSCEKEELPPVDGFEVNAANAFVSAQEEVSYPWNVYFKENAVVIGDYSVLFKGKTASTDRNGKVISTTFFYNVSGTGETAQLDSFYLGVPECAGTPLSWAPSQSSKLEGNMLKWNSSISKNGGQDFSVTYSGDVDFGLIQAKIVRGGVEYIDAVVGPCAGAYDLTGYVFVDANGDGSKDASESGLPNFTVVLEQGTNSAEVVTDQTGFYSFRVIPGLYDVSIKSNLLDETYYTPTFNGNISLDVPGELMANFGYSAETLKMTEDFTSGDITLTTVSAKDWGQAMKMAGKKNGPFTRAQAINLLTEVEGLLLKVPFDFGNDKISSAVEILTKPIQTDEDLFMQQLLAAELNFVTERGALDSSGNFDEKFNFALINYAEAKAAGEPAAAQEVSIMAATSRSYSLNDTSLLSSFNDNGSGGL